MWNPIANWFTKDAAPKKPAAAPPPAVSARAYQFGTIDRLTADWVAGNTDANSELRQPLKVMRQRARALERDNDYMRGFFRLLENNVLGHTGIGIEMKVTEMVKDKETGKWIQQYDRRANDLIEQAWARFCRRDVCSISADLNWLDIQRLALRSVARDGGVLVRKHGGGPFGFQLEVMEIDHLDTDWLTPNYNGNEVRLGVERDKTHKVVGYWIWRRHPGDLFFSQVVPSAREFVPVNQMFHVYRPDRIGISTGAPWMHSAGTRLKHLTAYEEAEVIAARAGASKMAFIVSNSNSTPYTGANGTDGQRAMEISPGTIEQLPPGLDMKPFDPTHPNANLPAFIKSELRGIAAGLGLSYTSFANDLEGVNYSSIRAGLLEEREQWKSVQTWFIDWFIRPVFEQWLETSLSLGRIEDNGQRLPFAKFDKFNRPEFKPRRWDWVDPLKDIQASVLAVEKGFTSRRQVIAEGGGDIERVFADQAEDKALEEENGLDFSADSGEQANTQPTQPKKGDDPKAALTPKDD